MMQVSFLVVLLLVMPISSLRWRPFATFRRRGHQLESTRGGITTQDLVGTAPSSQFVDLYTAFHTAGVTDPVARDVCTFAQDFKTRPEVLSEVLNKDFGFGAYDAHKLRAVLMLLLQPVLVPMMTTDEEPQIPQSPLPLPATTLTKTGTASIYKKFIVSPSSLQQKSKRSTGQFEYGVTTQTMSPNLTVLLEKFFRSMTEMSPTSQEAPIRQSTAEVYCRHAKLFIGWLIARLPSSPSGQDEFRIEMAFPCKEKEGARNAFEFVKWLRDERQISVNYEANVIRGLIRLAKWRFETESSTDPSYGEKSFDDIPAIKELRKIHRDACIKSKASPRVSDEKKKWLDWPEYLSVVSNVKRELVQEMQEGNSTIESLSDIDPAQLLLRSNVTSVKGRQVAILYQQFLVLAFFASIPDRQRTIRELELGRTFLREDSIYIVRHSAADYKTGRAYGARPPLPLPQDLTPWVDDFLSRWRPHLSPQGPHLFVQSRGGGAALTQDSVYQIVSRACYRHTGKRTNPHLLRDMVVTHVRSKTEASEKDLEALALFMGHSIAMQRKSYDRRTVSEKVAPAVALLSGLSSSGDVKKPNKTKAT